MSEGANQYDVLLKVVEVLVQLDAGRHGNSQIDEQTTSVVIKSLEIVKEKIIGDKFENISNSTIIYRSNLKNALNKVAEQHGDDAREALKVISDHIKQTEHEESAELMNSLNKELSAEKQSAFTLSALWNRLKTCLPDVAKVAGAVETLSKLFG